MGSSAMNLRVTVGVDSDKAAVQAVVTNLGSILTSAKNLNGVNLQNFALQIKAIADGAKGIAANSQVGFGSLKTEATAAIPSMESLAAALVKAVKGITDVGKAAPQLNKISEASRSASKEIASLEHDVAGLFSSFRAGVQMFLGLEVVRFVKGIVDVAARAEVLGTTLNIVAKNAGISAIAIGSVDIQVQRLGITAASSRESLSRMVQAGLDINKAPALARMSQDAAALSGGLLNSSQAFERMVLAIQIGRSEIVRNMGILVNFEAGYQKFVEDHNAVADATKITVQSLNEEQKALSRTNQLIDYGTRIRGAYIAAMHDVGKELTSLPRLVEGLKDALGKSLLPAYAALVRQVSLLLDELTKMSEAEGSTKTGAEQLGDAVRVVASVLRETIEFVARFHTQILAVSIAFGVWKAATFLLTTGTNLLGWLTNIVFSLGTQAAAQLVLAHSAGVAAVSEAGLAASEVAVGVASKLTTASVIAGAIAQGGVLGGLKMAWVLLTAAVHAYTVAEIIATGGMYLLYAGIVALVAGMTYCMVKGNNLGLLLRNIFFPPIAIILALIEHFHSLTDVLANTLPPWVIDRWHDFVNVLGHVADAAKKAAKELMEMPRSTKPATIGEYNEAKAREDADRKAFLEAKKGVDEAYKKDPTIWKGTEAKQENLELADAYNRTKKNLDASSEAAKEVTSRTSKADIDRAEAERQKNADFVTLEKHTQEIMDDKKEEFKSSTSRKHIDTLQRLANENLNPTGGAPKTDPDELRKTLEDTSKGVTKATGELGAYIKMIDTYAKRPNVTDASGKVTKGAAAITPQEAENYKRHAREAARKDHDSYDEDFRKKGQKINAETSARLKEAAQYELSIVKQTNADTQKLDDEKYKHGRLSSELYYAAKIERIKSAGAAEIALAQQELDNAKRTVDKVKGEDRKAAEDAVIAAQHKVNLLKGIPGRTKGSVADSVYETEQARTDALQNSQEELNRLREQIEALKDEGNTEAEKLIAIKSKADKDAKKEKEPANKAAITELGEETGKKLIRTDQESLQLIADANDAHYQGEAGALAKVTVEYAKLIKLRGDEKTASGESAKKILEEAEDIKKLEITTASLDRELQLHISLQESVINLQKIRLDIAAKNGNVTDSQQMEANNDIIRQRMDLIKEEIAANAEKARKLKEDTQKVIDAEHDSEKRTAMYENLKEQLGGLSTKSNELQGQLEQLGDSFDSYGKRIQKEFVDGFSTALQKSIMNAKDAGKAFQDMLHGWANDIAGNISKRLTNNLKNALISGTSQRYKVGDINPATKKPIAEGDSLVGTSKGGSIFDKLGGLFGKGEKEKEALGTRSNLMNVRVAEDVTKGKDISDKVKTGPGGAPLTGISPATGDGGPGTTTLNSDDSTVPGAIHVGSSPGFGVNTSSGVKKTEAATIADNTNATKAVISKTSPLISNLGGTPAVKSLSGLNSLFKELDKTKSDTGDNNSGYFGGMLKGFSEDDTSSSDKNGGFFGGLFKTLFKDFFGAEGGEVSDLGIGKNSKSKVTTQKNSVLENEGDSLNNLKDFFGVDGRGGKISGSGSNSKEVQYGGQFFNTLFGVNTGAGKISGPGTGTSDSIPAKLSHGEYVVPADKTSKFLPLLESIRSGRLQSFAFGGLVWDGRPIPSFADGGHVGDLQSIAPLPLVQSSGKNVTPASMLVQLHPDHLNMKMSDFIERELQRGFSRR